MVARTISNQVLILKYDTLHNTEPEPIMGIFKKKSICIFFPSPTHKNTTTKKKPVHLRLLQMGAEWPYTGVYQPSKKHKKIIMVT